MHRAARGRSRTVREILTTHQTLPQLKLDWQRLMKSSSTDKPGKGEVLEIASRCGLEKQDAELAARLFIKARDGYKASKRGGSGRRHERVASHTHREAGAFFKRVICVLSPACVYNSIYKDCQFHEIRGGQFKKLDEIWLEHG